MLQLPFLVRSVLGRGHLSVTVGRAFSTPQNTGGLPVPQSPHRPPGPHCIEMREAAGLGCTPVLPSACFLGSRAWGLGGSLGLGGSPWRAGLWMAWPFTSQTFSIFDSQGASLEIGYVTFST